MRGMRRFTLVPSLRVATSSATGTGLSEAAYFGFAIEKIEYISSPARRACRDAINTMPSAPSWLVLAATLAAVPEMTVICFLKRSPKPTTSAAETAQHKIFERNLDRLVRTGKYENPHIR